MSTDNRYFAGMGCRRGCSEESLHALLKQTLHDHGINLNQLAAIASVDSKRDESGLHTLAENLDVSLLFFSAEQLQRHGDRVSAASDLVLDVAGSNVAEAAALAAAEMFGGHAELIIPKCRNGEATCAIAAITEHER